jgi:hypothetical protein
MLRNVKKVLANPEPSTHDPNQKSGLHFAVMRNCDVFNPHTNW